MLNVNVASCQKGDIVASDVYDQGGLLIVKKNTVLNDYILSRLKKRGIYFIDIFCPEDSEEGFYRFRSEYHNAVETVKDLIIELQAGSPLDYTRLKSLASTILQEFVSDHNIVLYLNHLKSFDEYTYTHSIDTALYSMLIGKWLSLGDNHIDNLILAGLLHDIGKVRISNDILNKPGKLTDDEFNEVKKHSLFGYNLLIVENAINMDVLRGILQHHERFDGSGYPYGLKGYDIDLYGRIIAIADVYDAMTSIRSYKEKLTPFDAFDFFTTTGRRQFDPGIMHKFLNLISTYLTGSKVILTNDARGEIVYIPPHNIVNPVVKVEAEYHDLSKNSYLRIKSFV